ncbi:MAG: glycosyltransferase family 2 protein [bacterium]|nr:glycosyltransferase family 2 protein [bacterium]MDZ4285097.1 glycosyltransferase family 2 protein [Patescibacteria group bacterium]
MFFSILIPTGGNRPVLIAMAVRSVLAQTCQDFEIVVADVRGSEETKRAVLSSGDSRIRYFVVPQGRGPNYSFDYSALQARGRYILWFDDDNYLLPHALAVFKRVIDSEDNPDIVTASHLYYYDGAHPRHYLRNHLGVVPFTGATCDVSPRAMLMALFSFARRGGAGEMPRLHTSATVISREAVERAFSRADTVVFEYMPTAHSHQPILLSFARSCIFIDTPVVVVGRFGISMSQAWSTAARARFKRDAFPLRESPLTAHTYSNALLESFLRVKKLLPELVSDIPIRLDRVLRAHLDELVYLNMDARDFPRNWLNLFRVLHSRPRAEQLVMRRRALLALPRALIVFLGRRLGIHHRIRALRGARQRARAAVLTSREKMQRGVEFEIPFEKYGVRTIEDLGIHARDILLAELDVDVFKI